MNDTLYMLLRWARTDRDFRFLAYGYYLATEKLDAVERAYFDNIHRARTKGISA